MIVDIYDVGHGSCAVVTCPNGTRVMIDCGLRRDPPWHPSVAFGGLDVHLVVSNLDEDHLEDLPSLGTSVRLRSLFTNPTVDADALASMKNQGGMGWGVRYLHSLLARYGAGQLGYPPALGDVFARAYWNPYPTFTETNNLSVALFVRYGAFKILFAGDLEAAGWGSLLSLPSFAFDLATTDILVASHHGRISGASEEVFKWCRPYAVVFSDDMRRFDSQDTVAWYRARTQGVSRISSPHILQWDSNKRYVFTTRSDGTIRIACGLTGSFGIASHSAIVAATRRASNPFLP